MDDKKIEIRQFIEELDINETILKANFKKLAEDIKGPFIIDPGEYVNTSKEFKYSKDYDDKLKLALEFGFINLDTYFRRSHEIYEGVMHLLSVIPQIAEVEALKNWVKNKIHQSTPEELDDFKQKLEEDLLFRERILDEKSKQEYKSILTAITLHQEKSLQTRKSATKLEWTGQINQLSDLFRDLMFVKDRNGKTFITPTSIADLEHFIIDNFVHKSKPSKSKPKPESKPISKLTLDEYLKRDGEGWEKSVMKSKRLLASFFYKD